MSNGYLRSFWEGRAPPLQAWPKSYLSELENGKKEPCPLKIKELAQGLEISMSNVLKGT
jgi:hypothetical protein